MILSDSQWRSLKAIRWDKVRSRHLQQRVGDEKLAIGYCAIRKRWVIGRVVPCTVMSSFGSRTIPTAEQVPFIWKIWEDDDGVALSVDDPRLASYVQRCDLWRTGADKYLRQFEHTDWIQEQKEESERDDILYSAKQAYDRIKPLADSVAGYVPKYPVSTKWFGPTKWRQ